jgi:hypothetical protein
MITNLIDKQDSFELVRDQIAQILANESVAQQALAVAATRDPSPWAFSVYTERTSPWDYFLEEPGGQPIVNVWFQSLSSDQKTSNISERTKCTGQFALDVYASALASDDAPHGDEASTRAAHAVARLVRNILMSAHYTYLGFPQGEIVWRRWLSGLESLQAPSNTVPGIQVSCVRLSFEVDFNEFSPQFDLNTLEFVATDIRRASDGSVLAEADFDYS